MAEVGVNTLLGPSLDVADPGTQMEITGRSFGQTPEEVITRARAWLEGLHGTNPDLTIIAKHYPGYNVKHSSDVIPGITDDSPVAEIERRSSPFFTLAPELDGVMVSSITYSNIDSQPACFSKKIIDSIRAKHPDMVVITDDLYAPGLMTNEIRFLQEFLIIESRRRRGQGNEAEEKRREQILRRFPKLEDQKERRKLVALRRQKLKENAQRSFLAGCDILLTMDAREVGTIHSALMELIQSRPRLEKRLDDSVRRLLKIHPKKK